MSKIKLVALFAVVLLLVPSSSWTQTTTATLEGTVFDATGAVLAGASVEVKGSTVERKLVADQKGFYRAVALPAGNYRVVVSHPGFSTKTLTGIILVLDRTATLDITMQVAARAESVTVTAATPLIDTRDSSTRQVVDARTIDAIPLNGRNYLDLILLSPGVIINDNARSDLTNRDTRGAMLGERAANAAFLVNGMENNDDFHGGAFQSFTQDAIQEFEVIQAGYKAEFGRGSGGVVNVLTKSGTNTVHGSGFLFFRNDGLDSSNVPGQDPPALVRYNYGFTLGGPVRKDKAWLFGSLEQFQETRGNIFPPNIPASLVAAEDFTRQPENRTLRAFAKYSQRLDSKNDLRAEISFSRVKLSNDLAGPTSLPSNSNNNKTKTMLGTIALTTMFSPQLVWDNSFSVRGQNFDQNTGTAAGPSFSIFFLDDGTAYDFGPPVGSVQTLHQRYYTARSMLSFFRGNHSAKFGMEFLRTTADGENGQGFMDVIVTIRPFFDLFGTDSFQIPQGVGFFNPGDNLTRLRNNGLSLFAQDDWKLRKNFVLNAGVRLDYDSRFGTHNVAPRIGFTWSPDSKTVVKANWGLFYDRYRLGIVHSIPEFGGFNGRTVVELDYPRLAADALLPFPGTIGLFALLAGDPNFLNTPFGLAPGALVTESNVQTLTGLAPTAFVTAVNGILAGFGSPFVPVNFSPSTGYLRQDLGAGYQDEIRAAQPFRTPFNSTVTVGVQRELTRDLAVGATYIHRKIRHILGLKITNLDFSSRTIGSAITTDGGPLLRTYGPWYDGRYDALILTVDKRFGKHFQLQANYTKSKSIDNLLNSNLGLGIATQGGGSVPTDNLDINFDRGNSDLSIPDSFVTSGVVSLPANFWVSGVLRATSGVYFTAVSDSPTDYDGDGIVSQRPVGTSRNQFRGPKTANVDLRVEKRFTFGERYTASALVEFFNLFNARNPKLIDAFFVGGAPGPTFDTVRVPLPGREIQFGFRFQF